MVVLLNIDYFYVNPYYFTNVFHIDECYSQLTSQKKTVIAVVRTIMNEMKLQFFLQKSSEKHRCLVNMCLCVGDIACAFTFDRPLSFAYLNNRIYCIMMAPQQTEISLHYVFGGRTVRIQKSSRIIRFDSNQEFKYYH